jgi:hypothetical protein
MGQKGKPMTTHYNLENIRTLLIEGFSAEELRSFCFDQPDFRSVHDQLAEASGKSQIVHRLIAHADRKELFSPLLTWAEEQNPAKYKKYQPYHSTPTPNISSDDYGKSERAIEELVRRHQYKQAVFMAKRERDKLIKIGDKYNPDFQLKLGEFDVWYAHALMYTGAIDQALAILNDLITTLQSQKQLYQQIDHGLLRWNRVLGRAHNHLG